MQDSKATKEWWRSFIEVDGLHSAERKRRSFSLLAMSAIAIVVFSVLLITNYQVYSNTLSITLFCGLVAVIINAYIYLQTKQLRGAGIGVALIILILCSLLVYTGGKDNTALYWIMFYPVVSYTMLGTRIGTTLSIAMLIVSTFFLYNPELIQANYGDTEKSRFLSGLMLVITFSFISEYFRDRSHQIITNITFNQKQKANTDTLTGLPNRRFIDTIFIPKVQQSSDAFIPLSIVLMDIDKFKNINDTYGHDVGDKALMHIAKLMQHQLRYSDIFARFGGEEFIALLPHASVRQGEQIAEKLRRCLEQHPLHLEDGREIQMTSSFGVAEIKNVNSFDLTIKAADEALYQAKNQGRNRVVCG